MKPYKTVIYSFLVGGTFALIAQAILTFWQTVLVGTPMAFFMGGATLISMGVIGCILGGLACYQYVEEWATFGARCPALRLYVMAGRHEGCGSLDEEQREDGQVHLELRVVRRVVQRAVRRYLHRDWLTR